MSYTLVFGFSSSRDYARALRLAAGMAGYVAEGVGHEVRHSVPIDEAARHSLEELLRLVGAWRSSLLLADGIPIGRPAPLRTVLACERTRVRSGLGDLHCWGLPALARGRVPCRLLNRVLPWALDGEYANSDLLPRLLTAHARELLVDACSHYDEPLIVRSALAARSRAQSRAFPVSGWRSDELADDAPLRRLLADLDIDPDADPS